MRPPVFLYIVALKYLYFEIHEIIVQLIFKFEIKDAVCQTYSPRPLQLDFEKKVSMNLFQICGTVCQKCVSPVTLIELMPCHLQWMDSP